MTSIARETSTGALNKRILSVIFFTFFCYLCVGLPLAVLPGFVHHQLGYSSFIAGIIISLQYVATLISRPQAGRYADLLGPKKVVMIGVVLCGLSGVFMLLAMLSVATPWLSLALLALARLVLGVGESLTSTGATLWGINLVGSLQSARVISWNGVATYLAMAVGAPLGVVLNEVAGLAGFAVPIVLMGLLGFWLASQKPAIEVASGHRVPFQTVCSKIWLFGLALGLGTVGFGTLATFITLLFSDRGWSGAAFALTLFSGGFILMRLTCSNMITRYGGVKVTVWSFALEAVGLITIWLAPSALWVDVGAFLTGVGFSLVFPALGIEAVKQVPVQNQGTALGLYSAFLDLGLGLVGPVAGLLVGWWGVETVYLAGAMVIVAALFITLRIGQLQHQQRLKV